MSCSCLFLSFHLTYAFQSTVGCKFEAKFSFQTRSFWGGRVLWVRPLSFRRSLLYQGELIRQRELVVASVENDQSGKTEGRLGRRQESEEAASSSRADVPVPRISLIRPLVNRRAAVYQIISNFNSSYAPSNSSSYDVRPSVCFAPHMYGSGKTTLGKHFREFVLLNRQVLEKYIIGFPGIAGSGVSAGERAVEALLNETLYVNVDLRDFPRFDGEDFKPTLIKTISEKAVGSLPNESELLAKVLENRKDPEKWLKSLFQVTNKRYLFLFIDEIGLLPSCKFYQFPDLDPQRNPRKPNVYCLFFRVLSSLLIQRFVNCYLAGRSDAIITKQEDAISSRVNLDFVRLDPFSEDSTKLFIQGMKISTGGTALQLLFPKHPEGHDWFFKQVYNYTEGVPLYVRHVMQVLVNTCIHNKLYNLTEDEMYARIEEISSYVVYSTTPMNMNPNTLKVFSALLLSCILEYEFQVFETVYGGLVLGESSQYVLDIANNFGFYYEYCPNKGPGQVDVTQQRIKLVFPKIVFKAIKEEYRDYPLMRYLDFLFPLNVPAESRSSLGFRFEVIFAAILYVRCCLSRRLGELSIFHQSFVEDVVWEIEKCRVRTVPSFHSELKTSYSAKEQSYSLNAWKEFYDKFLSEDGVFLPNRPNSNGPDILVRVSVPIDDDSSSSDESGSSLTEMLMDTSSKKRRVYLIGIALKYYHSSRVSVGMIKEEVDKFLVPVSSQLDLEENDIWAIQLVVSTSYNNEVSSHFTEKRNWVMNTGVYYERRFEKKRPSPGAWQDASSSNSDKEGLHIGPNCQLVVCSVDNLKDFLGQQVYEQLLKVYSDNESVLMKLDPLAKLLGRNLERLWRSDVPVVPEPSQMDIVSTRTDTVEMQVTERKGLVSVRQGQFDWMEFLKTYCKLTESEASECLYALEGFSESEIEVVDTTMLKELGIDDPRKRAKIVTGMRSYARKKRQS
ncbi:hypothetical protein GAYE_SCF65G6758 [Galdieria yellowstonensis]|uniref:SAM domain-containing protein n=1 Tax=Galdieria yellowstonensis TaxID=3028027 RepID=A0AAV9INS8_9RHOD|nr:hypothetical protein GAYE_SCF65G6758 [Galdieria yellowstonensis]